jgi:hypothetical protein
MTASFPIPSTSYPGIQHGAVHACAMIGRRDMDVFAFIAAVCVPLTEQQPCEGKAKWEPAG